MTPNLEQNPIPTNSNIPNSVQFPLPNRQPRRISNPFHHPIGEPHQRRMGITFRDIQNLSTPNLVSLYNCMHQLYETNGPLSVNLTSTVNKAWHHPAMAAACLSPVMTEVKYFKL